MQAHRAGGDVLLGGRVLKAATRVWRVGHVAGPLDYPPDAYLLGPRMGRFDDPLKKYRTLYCARHQTVALRESLQHFRHSTENLAKLRSVYGSGGVPQAKVPDDWREYRVLAPARILLSPGAGLFRYEDPELLRSLEMDFAELLKSEKIPSLDIPDLRSKDRKLSQLFGRHVYSQGYAGIIFKSAIPPGGFCFALFEGRARLEAAGPARSLTEAIPAMRTVCGEFDLALA